MAFNSIVDCRTIYLFLFIWAEGRCGVVWCGDGVETNFIKKVNAKFQSWRRISILEMNSIYKSTLSTFLWLNIDSHIQMQNHRLANEGDVPWCRELHKQTLRQRRFRCCTKIFSHFASYTYTQHVHVYSPPKKERAQTNDKGMNEETKIET